MAAPEPDGARGAGKTTEDMGVTAIEDVIDNCHQGTAWHILKEPSLDKVVSKFADQARSTAQDDSEAEQVAKRNVSAARFDAVEHKTEQNENYAQQGHDDDRVLQCVVHNFRRLPWSISQLEKSGKHQRLLLTLFDVGIGGGMDKKSPLLFAPTHSFERKRSG